MSILSRLITFWAVLALLGFPSAASAQGASPWVEGHRSRVRLLAGGAEGGNRLAGIEIGLEQGFKTYWRNPGEAGLPPTFEWSKSNNLESAEVLWPVPTRSEDAGGVSYVYQEQVLFPVRIRPQDPARPVSLALRVDYGVCKDICIPARAELSLELPARAADVMPAIESALARIPKPQPLKADSELTVLGVEPTAVDGKSRLRVMIRAPAEHSPSLFVEPPDNWFMLAGAKPVERDQAGGAQAFLIDVLQRPAAASGPVDLRLTLVAGDKAIETIATLDAAKLER